MPIALSPKEWLWYCNPVKVTVFTEDKWLGLSLYDKIDIFKEVARRIRNEHGRTEELERIYFEVGFLSGLLSEINFLTVPYSLQ